MKLCLLFLLLISLITSHACSDIVLPATDEKNFVLFQQELQNNNLQNAEQILTNILQNTNSNQLTTIITLNLAQLKLLQNKPQEAYDLLLNHITSTQLSNQKKNEIYKLLAISVLESVKISSNVENNEERINEVLNFIIKSEDHSQQTQKLLTQLLLIKYPPCESFQSKDFKEFLKLHNDLIPYNPILNDFNPICPNKPIFIAINPKPHDRLFITLNLTPLNRKYYPDLSSQFPYADLDLTLLQNDLPIETLKKSTTPLTENPNNTDNQTQLTLNLNNFSIPANDNAKTPNTYKLKLESKLLSEALFSLKLNILPQCNALEDKFESNDMPLLAKPLNNSINEDLYICPLNQDYFEFDLPKSHTFWLKITSLQPLFPNLTLTLYNEQDLDNPITHIQNSQDNPSQTITYTATQDLKLKIKIESINPNPEGNYNLAFQIFPPCPQLPEPLAISEDDTFNYTNHSPESPHELPSPDLQSDGFNIEPIRLCPSNTQYYKLPLDWLQTENINDKKLELTVYSDNNPQVAFGLTLQSTSLKNSKLFLDASPSKNAQNNLTTYQLPIKNITDNTKIAVSTNKPLIYALQLNADKQNENNKQEDQKDEQQKNQQQNQQEQNQQKSQQNKDPSNQPSPTSNDDKTQGTASQQNPEQNDEKHSPQYDPKQTQKDRVNNLLDDIENGDKNLPLQTFTQQNPNKSIYNW